MCCTGLVVTRVCLRVLYLVKLALGSFTTAHDSGSQMSSFSQSNVGQINRYETKSFSKRVAYSLVCWFIEMVANDGLSWDWWDNWRSDGMLWFEEEFTGQWHTGGL
ncbi:hypothetical protein FOL47_008126 [Perkinsus chesapeaki]|uniref:Uncharacterized protein n=1 Tax=Perkinsus chesapeaki TaxID=330153 RepID=A0A7J6LGD3_PERCH|nr:hypothetical protein FOL47_008126 [Perkinsus chesapeaki]